MYGPRSGKRVGSPGRGVRQGRRRPRPLTRAPPRASLTNHGEAVAALRPQLPTRHSMLRFIIASQEAGIQKEILLTSDKL